MRGTSSLFVLFRHEVGALLAKSGQLLFLFDSIRFERSSFSIDSTSAIPAHVFAISSLTSANFSFPPPGPRYRSQASASSRSWTHAQVQVEGIYPCFYFPRRNRVLHRASEIVEFKQCRERREGLRVQNALNPRFLGNRGSGSSLFCDPSDQAVVDTRGHLSPRLTPSYRDIVTSRRESGYSIDSSSRTRE